MAESPRPLFGLFEDLPEPNKVQLTRQVPALAALGGPLWAAPLGLMAAFVALFFGSVGWLGWLYGVVCAVCTLVTVTSTCGLLGMAIYEAACERAQRGIE
jgi:hypothetical protein